MAQPWPRYRIVHMRSFLIAAILVLGAAPAQAHTSTATDAGEALQAWQNRHRPSENEVRAVLRMINNRYV